MKKFLSNDITKLISGAILGFCIVFILDSLMFSVLKHLNMVVPDSKSEIIFIIFAISLLMIGMVAGMNLVESYLIKKEIFENRNQRIALEQEDHVEFYD